MRACLSKRDARVLTIILILTLCILGKAAAQATRYNTPAWIANKGCSRWGIIGISHATTQHDIWPNISDIKEDLSKTIIWTEVQEDGSSHNDIVNYVSQNAFYKTYKPNPLRDSISDNDIYSELHTIIRGLTPQAFHLMKPWAIYYSMMGVNHNSTKPYCIDCEILAASKARGSRNEPLEEEIEGMKAFSKISESSLNALISDRKSLWDDSPSAIRTLELQWQEGKIAESYKTMIKTPPFSNKEVLKLLITQRTEKFADRIEKNLDHRDNIVLIGLMHLLGDFSIQSILAKRGFTIKKANVYEAGHVNPTC